MPSDSSMVSPSTTLAIFLSSAEAGIAEEGSVKSSFKTRYAPPAINRATENHNSICLVEALAEPLMRLGRMMPVMPSSHTRETKAAKYCRDEASVNLERMSCIGCCYFPKVSDEFIFEIVPCADLTEKKARGYPMLSKRFGVTAVFVALLINGCSAPERRIPHYLCQPYYSIKPMLDPTLDAKNIPTPGTGQLYQAEVGDTAIRRYLNARFISGNVELKGPMTAPIPMAIAYVNSFDFEEVMGDVTLTDEDIAALDTTNYCNEASAIGRDDEVRTKGLYFEQKIRAANEWTKQLANGASKGNTVILHSGRFDTPVYKAKNFDGASLWLFESPIQMQPRDAIYITHSYEAFGVWEQSQGSHMLLVRKFKVDKNNELISEEFLLMPSPNIGGVATNGAEYTVPWTRDDSFFDQELIYNGLSGSTVKFLYREFSGLTNRTSFEQEVTYDLNIGEIIGFKSARFKILSATNTGIEYEVIAPFNKDGTYRTQETH